MHRWQPIIIVEDDLPQELLFEFITDKLVDGANKGR
jgi:hypothetical protein